MALVCDIKSESKENEAICNEDLEDGEIEDDDEEESGAATNANNAAVSNDLVCGSNVKTSAVPDSKPENKYEGNNRNRRFDRGGRHEERKRAHLTEAEKSVMYLHKLERMEREKRERFKREQAAVVDDFACDIERAIANILKNKEKETSSGDEKEEKKGKKRKKKDRDKKKPKHRKVDSEKGEDMDESEMVNVRGVSPEGKAQTHKEVAGTPSPNSEDYDSYDSEYSSDRSRERRAGHYKKGVKPQNRPRDRKYRDRSMDGRTESRDDELCLDYMNGRCLKGNTCPKSHEPVCMKLELCKFYLMDCCAKGDNCLYLHSQFPCKYYHTGLQCRDGNDCKFAHGKALNDGLKQILYKHIETAPKEILGDYPRLTREQAMNMLNQTQKSLKERFVPDKKDDSKFDGSNASSESAFRDEGGKSKDKSDKPIRSRPSRWQDPEPVDQQRDRVQTAFGLRPFFRERDQDMRISSNGDVDMRTLPQILLPAQDGDHSAQGFFDLDIRKDTDTRQLPFEHDDKDLHIDEANLEIVLDDDADTKAKRSGTDRDERNKFDSELPASLPKKQRELFLRIQAQQKENVPENQGDAQSDDDADNLVDWYSDDDDDDQRLMIKDEGDDTAKPKAEQEQKVSPILSPTQIRPVEIMEKLGDLSKIDISADVTKLLSSISQSGAMSAQSNSTESKVPSSNKDPRMDPRRNRTPSTETRPAVKTEKLSIYEQGSLSIEEATTLNKDVDLRQIDKDFDLRNSLQDTDLRAVCSKADVDLRQLGLPFKSMQNYTPASEIDASMNYNNPIVWKVRLVDIPRPDYTGLKLSIQDAHTTGDPRLRKIFRLSCDEKESPASPKESPRASGSSSSVLPSPSPSGVRLDPRRRKMEEKHTGDGLNYAQQLNLLQNSTFYQTLTSNQKLALNQELASRAEANSGCGDPVLTGILVNLGLVPNAAGPMIGANNANALNILANVNNTNVIPSPMGALVPGAGLLKSMVPTAQPMMGGAPNNPAMLGGPASNFLGQGVSPNILSQNANVMNRPPHQMNAPPMAAGVPSSPMMGPNQQMANMGPDFQLNFDPRQGGLLGNAPPFPNFPDNNYNNYESDYYENSNFPSNSGNNRNDRPFNRDSRPHHRRGGGRNNFNHHRNVGGGRNFRNRTRSNRPHTPPP